jgi:hypothetical protein
MPTFYMPEPFDADQFVAGSKRNGPRAQGLPTRSDFKIGKIVR